MVYARKRYQEDIVTRIEGYVTSGEIGGERLTERALLYGYFEKDPVMQLDTRRKEIDYPI